MNKYRIFIDMDGVIADFEKASNEFQRIHGKTNRPDLHVNYRDLSVIDGAVEAVAKLTKTGIIEIGKRV